MNYLEEIEVSEAFEVLSSAMQKDDSYAWSWHCNLAMLLKDANVDHKTANIRAANFMKTTFGVDTSTIYSYKLTVKDD